MALCLAACAFADGLAGLASARLAGSARAESSPRKVAPNAAHKPRGSDPSGPFFRNGVIPRIKIEIPEAQMQSLRQQAREYVPCTIIEDGKTRYERVGVHVKGSAGSLRGIDDRPALTLNFDKFKKGQTFHGMDKVHLNNSAQDPVFLNELLSAELFAAAGIPAARTTHARVWLNGKDRGLFVLKEGFDKRFLKRHFADATGNLYEGGFVQDLDGDVRLMNGSGPADRRDVKAVVNACRMPDGAAKWRRMAALIDIDRFLTFMAMELMTCHWDGYCANRNNYRFYFDPASRKMVFFPHGMDQMFENPGFSILSYSAGSMVPRAVMGNPQWRSRYRKRVSELMKLFVPADRLVKRVEFHHRRLRPVLAELGPYYAAGFDRRVEELKQRLAARAPSLVSQNAVKEPGLPGSRPFTPPALKVWEPRRESPDARLSESPLSGKAGSRSLNIAAGPGGNCVASWRARVMLPAGRYRFTAKARAQGIRPVPDPRGTGAGIRISGGSRNNRLAGTTGWTRLSHEFQVRQLVQEVTLVAELKAAAGAVHFDAASMRLVRLGN
jgi:hypothetical protein